MKTLSYLAISAALLATAAVPSLNATTLDISEAKDFNLLTWGNTTQPNSDIEGRAAVGGNASFSSFSIGNSIVSGTPSDGSLIVGGNLSLGDGSVKHGQNVPGIAYVGGTYSGPSYHNVVAGTVPFDFAAAKSALSAKSLSYSTIAATGTSLWNDSTLTLTGNNAGLNIFNISGSDLDAASGLTLNVTAGSHVLINVSGSSVKFDDAQLFGFTSGSTLFNFYEATSLIFSGIGIQGSVLASSADVTFNNGQIYGQLIANSFTGGGELHNSLFNNQKTTTNVPETTSTALISAVGLLGCWLFRRFASNRR